MPDATTLASEAQIWDASKILLVIFNGAVGILVSIIGGFLVHAVNRLNTTLDKIETRMTAVEIKVASMEGRSHGMDMVRSSGMSGGNN